MHAFVFTDHLLLRILDF